MIKSEKITKMIKIKLTDVERQILNMLDEESVNKSVPNIKKHIDITNEELLKIIEKLENSKIIKKAINDDKIFYFFNKNAKGLGDKFRFEIEMGYKFGEGIKNGPVSKLRKFSK